MTPKPLSPPAPSWNQEPSEQKNWTVRAVLEWTTDFFARNGLDSPRLDAEVLLAHVLGEERLGLYLQYESTVPTASLQAYRGLIRRRAAREPVAYITGRREFYSISLSVGPSVLIPRPETEHLVEALLGQVQTRTGWAGGETLKILEIGTGSGNLCIALASQLPQARIVSLDISFPALSVAVSNVRAHSECSGRIRLLQGDLFEGLQPEGARFHLIVSNPPYVPAESWNDLPAEVRDFEPRVALDGGRQGTEVLKRILRDAWRHLLPDGALVLEIGEDQAGSLLGLAEETGKYRGSRVLEDYAGKPRVLVLMV